MVSIRAAEQGDVSALFALILELAQYEHLEDAVTGSADALKEHLFGDPPYVEALVAEIDQQIVGYALFFTSYSTFLTQPGLYLEDLYVQKHHRGQGVGKALLKQVAKLVAERNYGRLEWSVLDWNESAIAFYETLGATVLPDWRTCRVTGAALTTLASG
ncbi:GNAT family N-acetyltransferase [Acaryochloris marina]|uniref:Acetyltransferase, gnat family n=1 Tax=Acaryochloris marina (strain MBIC 11017) TaxID=329726 RepID=B0CBE5_ACAM1|nr:GNAT family N-acetyltransferase [Acaryochloris marina]ABW27930.1 acetyltransferase, gnat family [Acaryochloris marina MBIC11017]